MRPFKTLLYCVLPSCGGLGFRPTNVLLGPRKKGLSAPLGADGRLRHPNAQERVFGFAGELVDKPGRDVELA